MEQDKPSMDIEERDFNHHPWVKDEQTDTQVVESSTARDCLPARGCSLGKYVENPLHKVCSRKA